MSIISPTYLGEHRYPRYDEMKKILIDYLNKESITVDLDFLHAKEVDPYVRDIFIPVFRSIKFGEEYITFQTKSKERMKKLIGIFRSCIEIYSGIEEDDGFYKIRLYR